MASGMISEVFSSHNPRHGLIRVLTPPRLRGRQLPFFYTDVDLSPDDRAYLSPGMLMDFSIELSRANKVKPMLVAEYQASVVRAPQARLPGHGFIVCLDPTLTPVKVSADSYNELKLVRPPRPGDFCTVRIPWSEMLLAAKENRMILADIVCLMRRPPRVSLKQGLRRSDVESESDLRSCESRNGRSDEETPSSPDSIPEYAWHSGVEAHHRSKSVDGGSRYRDDANRSRLCSRIDSHYEKYDLSLRAMMQSSQAPRARGMFRSRALDGMPTAGSSLAGFCEPSQAALAAFYNELNFTPVIHQTSYQNPCAQFSLCCAHGYIL